MLSMVTTASGTPTSVHVACASSSYPLFPALRNESYWGPIPPSLQLDVRRPYTVSRGRMHQQRSRVVGALGQGFLRGQAAPHRHLRTS